MLDLFVESNGKRLRCGYTTGTCATAAAKAATYILVNNKKISKISVNTPKGIVIEIRLNSIKIEENKVTVSVIKSSGDDPDVTDGIEVFATAEKISKGFILTGGKGVGIVTKDGLSVKKGEYAINNTPRKTIRAQVISVIPNNFGVKISISVPEGIEIAKKTFNPRLGIKGGISIIGTTGIVYPMSEDALKESIKLEIKQKALKNKRIVLTFGNYGERCSIEKGFKDDEIVIISNYVGFALDCCVKEKIDKVILVGHIGKISKVAYGCFNTHSRVSDIRLEVIALELALLGYDKDFLQNVLKEKTSEGVVLALGEGFGELYRNIGEKIKKRIEQYTYNEIQGEVIMYSGYTETNILYNSLNK